MIFLTVGTLYPFDRLVTTVDDLVDRGVIDEQVFAQIGIGAKSPGNIDWVEKLDKDMFDDIACECTCMISHAGMGSILEGLKNSKPMLVMPRLSKYNEIINDHQVPTAEKFEELGHVLAAYDTNQIKQKYPLLRNFVPKLRQASIDGVIERISAFLQETSKERV